MLLATVLHANVTSGSPPVLTYDYVLSVCVRVLVCVRVCVC